MKKPLVSIVIPAYNSEQYIGATVTAALNQTYENIEVVVVDDCSNDQTVTLLREFTDSRLRIVCNETNLGMTGNWNKCVRVAAGEYVKLIPSDDIVYPDCVAKSVNVLRRHKDVALCITGTDLIDECGEKVGSYMHWPVQGIFDGKKIAKASVLFNNFFGNPVCAMFRKADFEQLGGFDPDIPYILDFDLWLGLASMGRVAVIKEHMNGFRVREDSNSGVLMGSRSKDYTAEHARLIDKYINNGKLPLNSFERSFSIFWRWLRNYIIAFYIRVKSKKKTDL